MYIGLISAFITDAFDVRTFTKFEIMSRGWRINISAAIVGRRRAYGWHTGGPVRDLSWLLASALVGY